MASRWILSETSNVQSELHVGYSKKSSTVSKTTPPLQLLTVSSSSLTFSAFFSNLLSSFFQMIIAILTGTSKTTSSEQEPSMKPTRPTPTCGRAGGRPPPRISRRRKLQSLMDCPKCLLRTPLPTHNHLETLLLLSISVRRTRRHFPRASCSPTPPPPPRTSSTTASTCPRPTPP